MKYSLAVFDFDGTLADSLPCFHGIMNRLAEQYHFRVVTPEEADHLRTLDSHQVLKHLGIPLWKLPWITRKLRQMMADEAVAVPLFPGIEALLRRLAVLGIQLAIVSSNSEENVRRILGAENAALFTQLECEASVFGKRPKLRRVVRKSGLRPEQVISIGDEIRDLQAAHAEGLAFGGVTWGYTHRDRFASLCPQSLFESVEDMGNRLTCE